MQAQTINCIIFYTNDLWIHCIFNFIHRCTQAQTKALAHSLAHLGMNNAGMPAGSHFVLWGGDGDTTLGMRNALAYDASRAMGEWAPRVQNCELFVVQASVVSLLPIKRGTSSSCVTLGLYLISGRVVDNESQRAVCYISYYLKNTDAIFAHTHSCMPPCTAELYRWHNVH